MYRNYIGSGYKLHLLVNLLHKNYYDDKIITNDLYQCSMYPFIPSKSLK